MANNDALLSELKSINKRLTGLEQGQARLEDGQAHLKTAAEAIAAGQAEIKETMSTKADVQDLKSSVMKKVNDHEERITELEKKQVSPTRINIDPKCLLVWIRPIPNRYMY